MAYTDGVRIYNETKEQLQGNEFGLKCLDKLLKYEALIPYEAMEAMGGEFNLQTGDENELNHSSQKSLDSAFCGIDKRSGQVEQIILMEHSEEMRSKLQEFAGNDFEIEPSSMLPFSILHLPKCDTSSEEEDVLAKLDSFFTKTGSYIRREVMNSIDESQASRSENTSRAPEPTSKPQTSTFFKKGEVPNSPSDQVDTKTGNEHGGLTLGRKSQE